MVRLRLRHGGLQCRQWATDHIRHGGLIMSLNRGLLPNLFTSSSYSRYNDPFLHIKLVSTFRPKFNASMYESCWLNKVERAPELDLELGGCSTSSKDGQSAPIGWYTVVGPSEDTSKRTTNITHQKAKRCPALNPFGRQSRVRSLFWPPSANQRAHDSVPKRQSWQLRRRQRPPLIAPRQANEEDTDPTMLFNLVILLHILANTNTS